jgi:HD superfamily phosphohydrolase YqeK
MLHEKLLEDEYIKNIYNAIENNKRIPISHGWPHIQNVMNYCIRFSELFSLNDLEKDTLLTAAILHDVAQVFLQPNHAKNGEFIVKEMLENNESIGHEFIKDKIDINRVSKIVGNHGGKKEEDYEDLLSGILIISDKLDITKDRVRPAYKKFDFLWFMDDIEKVHIDLDSNNLVITIITNKETTFEKLNEKQGLDKLPRVFDMFCKKHSLSYTIKVTSNVKE